MLYGFASSGKSTLAKKYTEAHPLSLAIEGDQIITMLGGWRENEKEARRIVFEHTKQIVDKHISLGHSVLLPYLLTDSSHSEIFEQIAKKYDVPFHEVYIEIPRKEAVDRLLERGVWGEEDSPKLTKEDLPEINDLFDVMEEMMKKRVNIKTVHSEWGNVDGTHKNLLAAVE